jgi:hypothetical protein
MARKKLLNLVQTFLTEYPREGCVAITQDGDGGIYYWRKTPKFNDDSDQWTYGRGSNSSTADALCQGVYHPSKPGSSDPLELEASIDYDTAIITRDMFDEATIKPKGDLREWRDRIIEIRELQESLKVEMQTLVKSIELEGFKIDVGSLPRTR